MTRIIDLTVPLTSGITLHNWPIYHGEPSYSQIIRIATPEMPESGGSTVTKLVHLTHHGTHIDAPEHQVPYGKQIDDYPIETFFGEALVVDIGEKELVTADVLEDRIGNKLKGINMLLFRGKKETWVDGKVVGEGGLTKNAIEWIAEHGIIAMNGGDVLNVKEKGNYRFLFQKGILNFHYLTNLDKIKKE